MFLTNDHSPLKKALIWIWKKKIWYGWKLNFNDYFHWCDMEFAHIHHHNSSQGAIFLVWWFAFAAKSFKNPYELDRNIVRFSSRRDKIALKEKLNQPIYHIELQNTVFNIMDVEKYLLDRKVPFDFILKNSSKIYGLDITKLDEVEFRLKFGYVRGFES